MRRVFGIGETVLDLMFKNDQPIAAKAGGSALNTMVSLARMEVDSYFITEIGTDKVGDMIVRFLEQNKLSTQYICRYSSGKSALALAFLNERNDAEYDFYKDYPSQRLVGDKPEFQLGDIVVFGSFFGLNPIVRPQLLDYLNAAKKAGAIIVYDPNFRSHHLPNRDQLVSTIEENFALADLVRGSDEDFENIYGTTNMDEVYQKVNKYCSHLVITANSNGVFAFGNDFRHHYHVPVIKPVSTIGAGDNFNAGMIKALIDSEVYPNNGLSLSSENWNRLITYGIEFSSEVCMQIDNYVPVEFKTQFLQRVEN